jgi:D-alanyl-D-alanine carboxypeptidase (penicillin-binding protein 5/6)
VKYEVDTSDPNNLTENPPQTTAKSLSIFDLKKMICVFGKNLDQKLEIASMTKIMTAYLICVLLEQDLSCAFINPKKVYFRASSYATKIYGTTAYIKEGLRYSIYDLLIGLMLPSGNDAALVLAENFGRFMAYECGRISISTLKD